MGSLSIVATPVRRQTKPQPAASNCGRIELTFTFDTGDETPRFAIISYANARR